MYELTTLLTRLYEGLELKEVVPELNPSEGEEYWTLDCPHCGAHDARAYKSNIGFIACQRQSDCGRPMSLYLYMRDKRGLATEDALKTLADAGIHLLELDSAALKLYREEERRMKLLEEVEDFFAAELRGEEGASLREHLKEKRKLTEDEIMSMRLGMRSTRERLWEHLQQRGFSSETDEKSLFDLEQYGRSHLLTLPYRDPIGNMKGFALMTHDPAHLEGRKYLWTAARDTFFNLHVAKGKLSAIVVADPLTALIASVRGFREIVATGKGGPSRSQIESAIPNAVLDFVLCLDGDKRNSNDISREIDRMRSEQIGLPYVMELPDGYRNLGEFLKDHDISEVNALYLKAFRENHGVAWKIKMILGKYPPDQYGKGGQLLSLEEIKSFQSRLTDPLDRELVLNIMRQVAGEKSSVLEESMASYYELRHRGQLHQKLQEISRVIRRGRSGNPEEVLKTVSRLARDLSMRHERVKPIFFPQTFKEYLEETLSEEQNRLPEEPFVGFPLKKFSKVAKAINGVQPGLYMIAGDMGAGKTALMTNLLLDLLQSDPVTRTICGTFDSNKAALRRRLMSILSDISLDEIQKATASSVMYAKKKKSHNQLMKYAMQEKLLVKDFSDINDLDDLEQEIRQRASDDLVVFLDGLQVLPDGNAAEKQTDKAVRMRRLSDIYRIAIFCTVDLTKRAGGPGEASPGDFAAMGAFAQTADVIMTLQKEAKKKRDRETTEPVLLTLQFDKNSLSGFIGSVQLELTKATGLITER